MKKSIRELRNEQEIISKWQQDRLKPVISIGCIAYNHEPYIEDALRGFLIQETDFPFEIIIHDDASTDKTTEIIRSYATEYPNIIKPIFQSVNQYRQCNFKPGLTTLQACNGDYIALCEGDDYWIDPMKLQKQFEFLEQNNDYSFCFHKVNIYQQNTQRMLRYITNPKENLIHTSKSILMGPMVISTLSIMFRNIIKEWPKCTMSLPFGDKTLEKLLALYGNGYCINEVMAVYRDHSGGVTKSSSWQEAMRKTDRDKELYQCLLSLKINDELESYLKWRIKRREAEKLSFFNVKRHVIIVQYLKLRSTNNIDFFKLLVIHFFSTRGGGRLKRMLTNFFYAKGRYTQKCGISS